MISADSLVFFGTGSVSFDAVAYLAKHFPVEAVVTKPDSLNASGQKQPSLVKTWANDQDIPVHQPANKAELTELFKAEAFDSRLGIVVDYGLILPPAVIDSFPLGILNSHFSLLPELRGPDPITAAILDGREQTGVSIMLIVEQLDEGPLLAQEPFRIPKDYTTAQLTSSLSLLSNQLLTKVIPHYISGSIKPKTQPHRPPSYTKKLTKADGAIDWHKPADVLEREVRAYLGWPGSYTTLADTDITITQAHVVDYDAVPVPPGQAMMLAGKELAIATGKGLLVLDRLKPAGKREMTGREFLAGHPIS